MKGDVNMIDKKELNSLVTEIKANLMRQIQLISKTADLIDNIADEIYARDDIDQYRMWFLATCNWHYRNNLRDIEGQLEDDELKLWAKILDITHYMD